MAIGTPVGIGTASTTTSSSPAITTSGAAPSSSLVIAMFSWGATSARTLNSVAGGGLTWAIDQATAYAGAIPWGFAVCSAQAPSGLASSTTITGTLSGGPFGTLMAVVYCTGLATATPKDVSDGNGQNQATWDTTAQTTTVADTLVIGGCLTDGTKTNTASGGATELQDFQYATEAWSMCTEYKILSSAASTSLTGTWTAGNTNKTSAFVAYKAASAAAEVIPHLVMPPPWPT